MSTKPLKHTLPIDIASDDMPPPPIAKKRRTRTTVEITTAIQPFTPWNTTPAFSTSLPGRRFINYGTPNDQPTIINYSTLFSSAPPPSPGLLPPIAIPTHPHLSFLPSGVSGPSLHPRDTHASSREGPVSAADVPSTQPEIAARSHRSVDVLEHESQTRQAERLKEHQRNTQTFRSYNRHIVAYEKFWEKLQTDRLTDDPTWQVVPSFPVTAMKTAVFLEYESTRSKVSLSS